jgi:hypothetical protein
MAGAQLKKVNADREMRQILEAREKEAHHLASIKKAAHDEGLAKGERKKQVEIAIKLARQGMPVNLIAEATDLSAGEVHQLIAKHT